jgi:hypothetical protein
MLDRVLLDANAILIAAFIPTSWSALVVSKLVARKSSVFVGTSSLSEAVFVARDVARQLGKTTDPVAFIEGLIRRVGAVEIPPADDPVETAIPSHDRHVAQEAITAKATVLTSDASLWAGLKNSGRAAILPLEALQLLDGMSLATTVFGVPPDRHKGSVFARVYPGGWAGMKDVGDFTVADFDGRLWMRYSTSGAAWVAELSEVGTVRVPASLTENVMQVVALSWEAKKSVQLRVAGVEVPVERPMPKPLSARLEGSVSIGHRANGQDHWNGAINVCVINDRPIGKGLWANLRANPVLTPNPYDVDRLRQAMNRVIV